MCQNGLFTICLSLVHDVHDKQRELSCALDIFCQVLTRTWGALRKARRSVAIAISLWIMQSTHSSSAQIGAWQGRASVRQWVLSSLLTQLSLWCSSLNRSGRSWSHSSHLWWRRESSMDVGRVTTGRASEIASGPAFLIASPGRTGLPRRLGWVGSFPSPS